MTKYEVLNQLNNNEVKTKDAYKLLFSEEKERKPRRAAFVKVKINIPESKGASVLLGVLLFIPIPIGIIKLLIPRRFKNTDEPLNDQIPLSPKDILELISFKGIKIDVRTHDDVNILIKTI